MRELFAERLEQTRKLFELYSEAERERAAGRTRCYGSPVRAGSLSRRPLGVLLWVATVGCSALPAPPGSENLGAYSFVAEPLRGLADGGIGELTADGGARCALPELVPATVAFEGRITRDPSTGQAWLTLGPGYPRDATWDGQVLESEATVARLFPSCAACGGVVARERIRFALMSRSQSVAVGRRCPQHPLDGGIPTPPGPDGTITGPAQTSEGFDALYACGELTFAVAVLDGGADCPAMCSECVVNYGLQGERR